MQDNSEEDQLPCIICNEHHEQMLMLSCVHDPCINCAARHFCETEDNTSMVYTCSKCGEETELDDSSVLELRKVYNQMRRKRKSELARTPLSQNTRNSPIVQPKNRRETPVEPSENTRKNNREDIGYPYHANKKPSPSTSQPTYSNNPKKNAPQLQYPCSDHPQEELTYFCFSCSQPICPECAIHGLHKEHQVETTRKAIKQIRGLLAENKVKLQTEAKCLLNSKDQGKKEHRELAQENRRDQDYIRKKITHLKNVLAEKEKELLKVSQANFQKNIEKTKQEDQSADKSLNEITGMNRSIDVTLKKEDLVILQQFNKRDEEVNELLEKIESDKEKISDYFIKNPHRSLNLGLFDEDIDRILSDIYSIKLSTTVAKQSFKN